MTHRVRVFAPATISNLGPGFDVLGLALQQPGDVVEVEVSDKPGVQIVEVTGAGNRLTTDSTQNVAGVAAADVLQRIQAGEKRAVVGVRLWLHKQMPLASGLGSSAASSVAGAVAINELLDNPLSRKELISSALKGEYIASGSIHADNVAPSLLGGIVLIRSYNPLELVSLPIPPGLRVIVVHPHFEVETSLARALVNEQRYELGPIVTNLGNLGAFVGALYENDLGLFSRSICDRLIEPIRAKLIPGFQNVKDAALKAGALGCSISGGGPAVFAFSDNDRGAASVAQAMCEAFKMSAGLDSKAYVGLINTRGAHTVTQDT